MLRRAAEAVVKIDVAAGGVDVVAPQEARDPPAGPDAFRRPCRARQLRRRLFVFLDGLGRFLLLGLSLLGRLLIALGLLGGLLLALGLFGGLLLPARLLGGSSQRRQQQNAAG